MTDPSTAPFGQSGRHLPSGTVTFLFTDIEDSTKLWEEHPGAMKSALAEHDAILKHAITSNHGYIIKGTGDGIHAVFEKAIYGVNATLAAQRALFQASETSKNSKVLIRSRMGLHTGEAELRENDYYGQTLNRAARIMAVGHGGQILISGVTAEIIREQLPADIALQDLGEHRLKDLIRPERLYQLNAADLTKDFPALKSLNIFPNNLPLQLTSFIGRERQVSEANKLLSSTRLLTFIGPGGTGKTRLSLQVAVEQFSEFKDGIWMIELAPLSDPAFIPSTIASVLELREVPNIPLMSILLDYLRARQTLLVIDNCEHLVEASAQIANQLLHGCPQLKIIASSREALGIDGETIYRVPSLPEEEATRLFVERAVKADSRFKLTENNTSAVAQICSRLDGIPLAIELAAARVKLFTVEQIAERLNDRFRLLTGGSRTALPRQQTLRALIDWSYQSLNETEQRTLRRLAVFSGGWSFEAAESVVGADEAMDGLLGLVNKSLVNVEEQDGVSRYSFLETIRQYAMEKLVESGEATIVRDRQLDYILNLAERLRQSVFGSEDIHGLDRIEVEHDNLRVALEWAIANHPGKALKLAFAIGGFWTVRDYNNEARTWCNAILENTKSSPGLDKDRARLYGVLGWASVTMGEHKVGRFAAEQAIALGHKAEDPATIARGYGILALTCMFLGDYSSVQRALVEGESLARQHGLASELAMILSVHAQVTYYAQRDAERAKVYLEEATHLAQASGFRWGSAFSAYGLARIAAVLGDLDSARIKFAESIETARKLGNKRIVYSSQSELAHILREYGEWEEAFAIYKELLPKWKDLGHRAAVAHELECIAYILLRKEEPELAANLLGAAEALRNVIDSSMTKVEQDEYQKEISTLRSMLEEEEFRQQWDKGAKMTIDEAIDLAQAV